MFKKMGELIAKNLKSILSALLGLIVMVGTIAWTASAQATRIEEKLEAQGTAIKEHSEQPAHNEQAVKMAEIVVELKNQGKALGRIERRLEKKAP